MGYADNFKSACPLDSLSWVSMHPLARVRRLASRFLKEEEKLKRLKEKGEWNVTAGVVRPWLLSIYEPPRGQLSSMIPAVMDEIERQRGIRKKRAANRPWKWKEHDRAARLKALAPFLYGIATKNYEGKRHRVDQSCRSLATISGILMALDVTPEANVRVYMRHRETGKVKVVITDVQANYSGSREWSLTRALLKMAPVSVQRSLFSGHLIAVDFDRAGFLIDGEFHAFRHISKIVEGPKRVMSTPMKVDKRTAMDADEED